MVLPHDTHASNVDVRGVLPLLLAKVLVVVSFHWSLSKLTLLTNVMNELASYGRHTHVDIIVITNKQKSLETAFLEYDYPYRAVQFNASANSHKYDLLWEHRHVVAEEFAVNNHTTFIYIEDDTLVPWTSLVSWAIDTEVLEPLNFTRSMYRTEVDEDGTLTLNDMMINKANSLSCKINVTTDPSNPETVATLNVSTSVAFRDTMHKYQNANCLSPSRFHSTTTECVVHSTFLQMYNPYQGMWILTRRQLQSFMAHELWDKNKALRRGNTRRSNQRNWEWGFPERSAGMNLFVNAPPGWHTNNLIPYVEDVKDGKFYLSKLARVHHIRNGYQTMCHADAPLAT